MQEIRRAVKKGGPLAVICQQRYGASWLQPTFIQSARLFKFAGQIDF
jgi:hypothetical protein